MPSSLQRQVSGVSSLVAVTKRLAKAVWRRKDCVGSQFGGTVGDDEEVIL